jgi:hypothetical protein
MDIETKWALTKPIMMRTWLDSDGGRHTDLIDGIANLPQYTTFHVNYLTDDMFQSYDPATALFRQEFESGAVTWRVLAYRGNLCLAEVVAITSHPVGDVLRKRVEEARAAGERLMDALAQSSNKHFVERARASFSEALYWADMHNAVEK